MDKDIIDKVGKVLQEEFENIQHGENDLNVKYNKMNDILHLLQILDHMDELEPIIAEHLNKTAQTAKFQEDR